MKLNLIEPHIVNHDETIDEAGERITIAELTETSVSNAFGLVKTRFSAVLTEAGSKLFNGQYPAVQQMEEVEVVLRG